MSHIEPPRDRGLAQWDDEGYIEPGARRITKLDTQRKDPNRVSVFLDGEFAFGLPRYVVLKHMLRKGLHISEAFQKELLLEDQLARAKAKALEYLSYCARTEHEVAEKLRSKEFDEAIIVQVIERFIELRYLDDELYARLYAYSRLRSKGRGPKRIQMELKRRGVIPAHIDAALEQLRETEDFVQELLPRAQKRWAKLQKEPNQRKRRQKLLDFLLRQGFSFQTAHQIFSEIEQIEREERAEQDPEEAESHERVEETTLEAQIADYMPYAEKRWARLQEERDPYKRRKKLTDSLLRKGAPYALIRLIIDELPPATPQETAMPTHEEHSEEEVMDAIRPIAEKRWARLEGEGTHRRRQKLSEFLRRRSFSFDAIRAITEELEAKDAEYAAEFEDEEDEYEEEEVDPLEVIRPLAEKRWRRLCKGESNARKRRQKLTDYLRRQGFTFSQISPIFEELEGA